MKAKKFVILNNGIKIPSLGLGVFRIPKGTKTEEAVTLALKLGYKLIDTAALYGNEIDVGKAIIKSGIPRKEIFITTKLHPLRILGIRKAFYKSLRKLGLNYIDLYLIHLPFLRTSQIWKELEKIYKEGRVKAIGVSNFNINKLKSLLKKIEIIPAVNQVEFHPFLYRKELLSYCNSKGIVLEAHSPLVRGKMMQNKTIKEIAKKYKKSEAQIMIRWSLQQGIAVIPKSTNKRHLKQNIDVFDFNIKNQDMNTLNKLNKNYYVAWLSKKTS